MVQILTLKSLEALFIEKSRTRSELAHFKNIEKESFLAVRAAFEVPLGVEKVCAVGVGSALGDSDDAGRGMEGAEGKVSSFERIEFARADVSLDEGIIAI